MGGLITIGAAIVTPAAVAVATGAAQAAFAPDEEAPPVIEEEVIAARFVRLGRDFQDELPNRFVPQAATAPSDAVALSENPDEPQPERPRRERPPDALERSLDNLLERSDLFAEEAEAREMEGNPDGIEEGTETEATDGDVYAGQLYAFFRRGWTVPTTITEEERRGLSVEATINVAENLQIVTCRLRGSSGNADFDQSVIAQIERLRANNVAIPEPPLSVRIRYVGQPFTLRFRGRNARSE